MISQYRPFWPRARKSYSQCGEDVIVEYLLNALNIKDPNYLDIGTNHPTHCNNTYLFYKKGSRGVCIEPNPQMYRMIRLYRPRDKTLNVGIGTGDTKTGQLHVMDASMLSTMSSKVANEMEDKGWHRKRKTIDIPLLTINDVIQQYFPKGVYFLSLDIEGMDLAVIETLDFHRFRPAVVCVETVTYAPDGSGKKVNAISKHLTKNGYFLYADTYINSIFVEMEMWRQKSGVKS